MTKTTISKFQSERRICVVSFEFMREMNAFKLTMKNKTMAIENHTLMQWNRFGRTHRKIDGIYSKQLHK